MGTLNGFWTNIIGRVASSELRVFLTLLLMEEVLLIVLSIETYLVSSILTRGLIYDLMTDTRSRERQLDEKIENGRSPRRSRAGQRG